MLPGKLSKLQQHQMIFISGYAYHTTSISTNPAPQLFHSSLQSPFLVVNSISIIHHKKNAPSFLVFPVLLFSSLLHPLIPSFPLNTNQSYHLLLSPHPKKHVTLSPSATPLITTTSHVRYDILRCYKTYRSLCCLISTMISRNPF